MKVLTRLNLVNFKQNRVRTAVTIVGVALSITLILTVIGVATSIWYSIVEDARSRYGDYHVMYEDVPGDKIELLEQSKYYNVMYYSEHVSEIIDEEGVKHLYWIGPYPKESYKVIEQKDIVRDEEHVYNVFLKYKDFDSTENDEKMQTRALGDAGCDTVTVRVNINLQMFEGDLGKTGRILFMSLSTLAIGTMAIIAAFIIRNSFSISITERVRQFGMLSSVGARPRQIRRMVYQEALLIGLAALPFGLLLGALLTWGVVLIVNNLLVDIMTVIGSEMLFFIPWQAIVICFVVGLIIVFLSAASPAIVASRYSPIYALRSNQDVKIKARKVRTSKLTRKIWGMGGVIARKNLKRSRQKYRTTVISIVLSVVALISVVSFMDYNHKIIDTIVSFTGANFIIGGGEKELYEDVIKKFELKNYAIYKTMPIITEDGEAPKKTSEIVQTVIVSRDEFERFAKNAGLRNVDLSRTAILFDTLTTYHADGSPSIGRATNLKVGDKHKLVSSRIKEVKKRIKDAIEEGEYNIEDFYNDDVETTEEEIEEIINTRYITVPEIEKKVEEIEITAISDSAVPIGYHQSTFMYPTLFISEDYYRMSNIYLPDDAGEMYIADSGKGDKISQYLDQDSVQEKYGSCYYEDTEKLTRVLKNIILLAEILTYGFIIIVSLIGVTNIFNTITTNVALRAKEFAILKSVGMTNKEFNRMIRLESIMYSTRALMIGIPIGLLVSYGISQLFDAAATDFGWIFPWSAIIISIVSVAILVAGVMRYSVRAIKKQNIIETIRKESF